MNLYKLTQNENNNYDTYDSVIICAETPEEAKRIHPSSAWKEGGFYDEDKKEFWTTSISGNPYLFEKSYCSSWTNNLDKMEVKLIGVAEDIVQKGVVLASFNAG